MLFFSRNKRRRHRTTNGNYAFRRKKPARTEIHRLDLNPETAATRAAAFRRRAGTGARWAFGLLAAIVFIALIKVVVMEAFVDNSRFRLQHVEVVTTGPLSKSAIEHASGLHAGDNLLMISLRAVRDILEALPEVRSARVTRNFPGVIVLDVTQRTPVAWLECPGKSIPAKAAGYGCLLDEDGTVVPSVMHAQAEHKLPVIYVEILPRIAPGSRVESPAVIAALNLLKAHQAGPLGQRTQLSKVDATRAHALVAQFGSGLSATFPANGNPKAELLRLQRALDEAARRQWRIATVNLLVAQNVPVTLRGSPETAATHNPGRALAGTR